MVRLCDCGRQLPASGARERVVRVCALSSQYGRTALHWAACNGHVEVAKPLLDAGACLEARDDRSKTPLQLAVLGYKYAMVRFLRPKVHWSRMRMRFHAQNFLIWWLSKTWAPGKRVEKELRASWELGLCLES